MVTPDEFKAFALTFPQATEAPHFEITSFRVVKKIFATLNIKENRATIKLSSQDQDIFCSFAGGHLNAVPNKWGKQGWTHIHLDTIELDMCMDALTVAYCEVAPKKLAALVEGL